MMVSTRGAAGRSGSGRLRMAVPKGALWQESLDVLASAGIELGGLTDPGRQLIFDTEDIEFVIGKPSDIPAYVAYGAVDVGIVGKDVLAETELDVVEMVDLRFGACRFVVAELEDEHATIEEQYRHLGVIRVATKYPRVTERHFAARGIQVEVVKLNGNIEMAPLIGIADRVVDITQTGTTLRENRLRIVEEVMESSARFIANRASLTTRGDRVTTLAGQLSAVSLQ